MRKVPDHLLGIAKQSEALGRRQFLKLSGVAAAAVASGALSIAPTRGLASVPGGINFMTEDVYKVWHKLMTVLLPTEGTKLIDPETLPVLQTVDGAFLATMPPAVREGLFGGVAFFNSAAEEPFGKPFVDLDQTEAALYCDALAGSDDAGARGLFRALMFLTVTAYWAIPPVWGPVGYDGPITLGDDIDYAGNQPLPQA